MTWQDFQDAGCSRDGDIILYPIRKRDGVTVRKFKAIVRGENGKRLPWGDKGSGFQRGLFDCGLDHCAGAKLVLAEGEEKAIAAKIAGFSAVSPANGASGLHKDAAAMIANASPARVIIAFDADDGGTKGTEKSGRLLRAAGVADIRRIVWPEDVPSGYDLNNVLVENDIDSVRDLLDSAVAWEPSSGTIETVSTYSRDWGEVGTIGPPPPEEFPLDMFAGIPILRDFVHQLSWETQTPPDAGGMAVLAALATCTARRFEFPRRGPWWEPLNLFTLCALPPANRKSAVFGTVRKPLDEYEEEKRESERIGIVKATRQKDVLKGRLEKAEKELTRQYSEDKQAEFERLIEEHESLIVPAKTCITVGDVTVEQLATIMAEQGGRVALFSAEGSGLFSMAGGRYSKSGATSLEIYLSGHGGDSLKIHRRGREEVILQPALTVALMIQPAILGRNVFKNQAFRDSGLLDRFLIAMPESWVGRREIEPQPMTNATETGYRALIRRLLEISARQNEPKCLWLSRNAFCLLKDFERQREPRLLDEFKEIAGFAGKLHGAILRVAGNLHLAAHCQRTNAPEEIEVSGETMELALFLAPYLLSHAKVVYHEISWDETNQDARALIGWIECTHPEGGTVTLREMQRGKTWEKERTLAVCEMLCAKNYLRHIAAPPSPGPATIHFEINPVILPTTEAEIEVVRC